MSFVSDYLFLKHSSFWYFREKKIQPQFVQRTWHENFIHSVRIIPYEAACTYVILKMKFHTRMTRAGRENCVWPFVFTGILFFFPKWSASRKKNWRTQKLHELAANWRPIVRTDSHGRHRIDRSVSHSVCPTMSFWHRDSRKLRLRSFLLPEALYRGNAIYWQWSAYTGGKKRYTRIVYIRAYLAPGRRGVNWIFRPVSFGVTFHNVCHISTGHSVFAMPQI